MCDKAGRGGKTILRNFAVGGLGDLDLDLDESIEATVLTVIGESGLSGDTDLGVFVSTGTWFWGCDKGE
jgi:hypothetical protein